MKRTFHINETTSAVHFNVKLLDKGIVHTFLLASLSEFREAFWGGWSDYRDCIFHGNYFFCDIVLFSSNEDNHSNMQVSEHHLYSLLGEQGDRPKTVVLPTLS